MNVRKYIKALTRYVVSPDYRFLINAGFGTYNKLSDEAYLKRKFKACTGNVLDLQNPVTFNEKLQWLKIYDRKPIYTTMVDKYEAKKYVAEQIGQEHIIPTMGLWEHFDEIDFEALPAQFVLKCTHDSGGLVICQDKTKLDRQKAKRKIQKSLATNYYLAGREWPYKNVKPRIIAEEYLEDHEKGGGLTDYKFFCFNGEPKFLYVSRGLENHETAQISFLTLDWEFAPFRRKDYRSFDELPQKPICLNQMVLMAKKLSEDTAFLRVDFYEVDGNIYFSELTFYPCSGYLPFDPPEWDKTLGDWITLPEKF